MTKRGQEVLNSFTPKQREILALLSEGYTNKQIAERAHTTEQVIKNYVGDMNEKCGTENRLHLVLWCMYHGVLACPCSMRAERAALAQA